MCQWHHLNCYGFITPMEGGKDIYVPRSAIVDGDSLRKGDIVQFQATCQSVVIMQLLSMEVFTIRFS